MSISAFGWAVLAAIAWGIAPALEKLGLGGKADPTVSVFVRSLGVLIGALGFFAFSPDVLARAREMPLKNILYLMAGGLLASILGQICFYRALKLGDISRVVPIGASYPVLAFLLGLLIFHESLTAAKVGGIVLVMSGVYLLR